MTIRQRLQSSFILMFFAFIVTGTWAGPAGAVTAPSPTLTVSDRTPAPGSTITFCGSGFQPGEIVNFILVDLELSAVADASGHFCTTFPLVRDHNIVISPGPLSLAVMGASSGLTASIEIVIGPAVVPPATEDELAFTGPISSRMAGAGGLLLVAVGAMMFFAGRRRNVDDDV